MKTPEEISALLAKAQEHLDKSEYALAEGLAGEVLARKNESSGLSGEHEAFAHCILGECCQKNARSEDARAHFQKALALAQATSNLSIQSRAVREIGYVEEAQGDHAAALLTAGNALTLAETAGDKDMQARALGLLGTIELAVEDATNALGHFARALALAEEIGSKRGLAVFLSNLGVSHKSMADHDRAMGYFTRALEVAELFGNKELIANNLSNIAQMHSIFADYPRLIDTAQRAATLCEEVGLKRRLVGNLNSIGLGYLELAEYDRSLDYFGRSLALAEELSDKQQLVNSLGNIGVVYERVADLSRALEYYSRALSIVEMIGYTPMHILSLLNVGGIHAARAEYELALDFYRRARMLGEKGGNPRYRSYVMHATATVEQKMGNLDSAYETLVEVLPIDQEVLKASTLVARAQLELGEVCTKQGKFDEGMAWLMESLRLVEQLGEKRGASDAHKCIADLCAKRSEFAEAFDHFQQHYALEKEIYTEESRKRIEQFNMRVAISEKARDAELQRLRAERSERDMAAAAEIMRLKERDLANTASSLAAQTELLGNFRADLRKIVLRPDRYDAEDIIKQVRAKLKELPCEMIDFSKFEGQFATVHPEFRAKLEMKYPELTAQEVKMCMLVYVNLQSAAIARLMCISERTVDTHRFRIRKKMALATEVGLKEHLQKMDRGEKMKDER